MTLRAFFLCAVIVAVDQITKYFVFIERSKQSALEVPGFLELTRHMNQGVVANIPVPRWIIVIVSLTIIIGCFSLMRRRAKRGEVTALALAILVGGALGNLIDRIALGHVRDWILLFGRSVINLADIAIAVGALWYCVAQYSQKTEQRPSPSSHT